MTSNTQKDYAEKAQAQKADAAKPEHPGNEPSANSGMNPQPNMDIAPSGALDAEGHKVVVERSRKAR